MSIEAKASGVWHTITDPAMKVAGVWENATQVLYKIAGVWEEVWPGDPEVSLSSSGVTNSADLPTVYAGVSYSGGVAPVFEYSCNSSGSYATSRGLWLDAGDGADVWLERTINSGSLNSNDPGAGRHQMSSAWGPLEVSDSSYVGGPNTCNVTVKAYDAASGGNLLDSVTYTLSAERAA